MGWHLLDSGALYRLVALAGQPGGLDPQDSTGHARLAGNMARRIAVRRRWLRSGFGSMDEDVTLELRSEQGGRAGASRVAPGPVRKALLERQHAFAAAPGLMADGRDMGTVVFPEAALKIFLMASPEERALRRYKQLKERIWC